LGGGREGEGGSTLPGVAMLGDVPHREHELGGRVLRAMRWGDV